MKMVKIPRIIQGGMGVAISNWELARAVSQKGQLGVVSGTGIGIILVARLMQGDKDGHVRRALSHFPMQDVAERILDEYYVEGGKGEDESYKRMVMWTLKPPQKLNELTVVGNFMEVWLAKEGHDNPVGINLLEKVQMPNMASVYGAMLAGVDVVIMGAGVPMQVPGNLDLLAQHQAVSYRVDVVGANKDDDYRIHFYPEGVFPGISETVGALKRPLFFPIISSNVLAQALLKRATGKINGFVIETAIAGGHNAPPRGKFTYNDEGEPIYGKKDVVDLEKMREIGLPFWLAGGYGRADKLQEALDAGAAGIQVGTAFAYSNESGMADFAKSAILQKVLAGTAKVRTDPLVSPTGFPFKVVRLEGTLSEDEVYQNRRRICDLGYLRHLYKQEDGRVNYRCPSEPVDTYVKKGGKLEDTVNRTCLCNNLGAAAGFPQRQKWGEEPALITSGDDLVNITRFIPDGETHYGVQQVINVLTNGVEFPSNRLYVEVEAESPPERIAEPAF